MEAKKFRLRLQHGNSRLRLQIREKLPSASSGSSSSPLLQDFFMVPVPTHQILAPAPSIGPRDYRSGPALGKDYGPGGSHTCLHLPYPHILASSPTPHNYCTFNLFRIPSLASSRISSYKSNNIFTSLFHVKESIKLSEKLNKYRTDWFKNTSVYS